MRPVTAKKSMMTRIISETQAPFSEFKVDPPAMSNETPWPKLSNCLTADESLLGEVPFFLLGIFYVRRVLSCLFLFLIERKFKQIV